MMRRFILAAAALLIASSAHAAYFQGQTYIAPAVPQITCNLVTGVASVGGPCTSTTTCNGSGDDAPAFKAFNTWARANQGSNQVVLTIPNGSNCVFNSGQSYSGTIISNAVSSGIKNLIVEATGATMAGGTTGFNLGTGAVICHFGLTNGSGCSARIQSVSAGATQVSLTAASFSAGYISRFTVGQWLLFGGVDLQGIWNTPFGYPPNNQFFEWRKITAICNNTGPCSGGATITVDRALTNSYLSTWPSFNTGNAFEADPGGPATIWAISDAWDATLEYRGLTHTIASAQSYAEGRNVIFRNVTITGCCGLVPSQNESFSAYNTTWSTSPSPGWEVDKFVGTVTLDTVSIPRVDFQSSSSDLLVMRNSTIGSQFGTPKNAQLTDTSWSGTLRFGAWTNGASTGSVTCTRCAVTTFDFEGGLLQNRPTDYSMSSGVISFANTNASGSDPDQRPFVPGGNIYWSATGYISTGLFQAQAITQDPTNVFIQTNEAGTFPTIGTNIPQFRTHPAPQFTCDSCTGDATLVATNIQNGATALAPLGQFGFRSYTPSANGAAGSIKNKGKLTSLTIDVTTASTHTGAITLNSTGQFHNFNVDQSGWTQYDWVPQINLKQVGTRVITSSGTTCNGSGTTGCAGDACVQPASGCFAPPSTMWIQAGIDPFINGTFSGGVNPQFTMTLRTNQGVVP